MGDLRVYYLVLQFHLAMEDLRVYYLNLCG
jgi:hypothetical protein